MEVELVCKRSPLEGRVLRTPSHARRCAEGGHTARVREHTDGDAEEGERRLDFKIGSFTDRHWQRAKGKRPPKKTKDVLIPEVLVFIIVRLFSKRSSGARIIKKARKTIWCTYGCSFEAVPEVAVLDGNLEDLQQGGPHMDSTFLHNRIHVRPATIRTSTVQFSSVQFSSVQYA